MKNISRRLAVLFLALVMVVSLCSPAALAAEEALTPAPEVTAEPEATVDPEATAEPDTTVEPETTAEPEATAEPNDGISTIAVDGGAAYYDPHTGETKTVPNATLITDSTRVLTEGYYYAEGNVRPGQFTVTGNVDLILADDAELAADGYGVTVSGALNIWAGSAEGNGRMYVGGTSTSISGGSLNIYGGTVLSRDAISVDALSICGGTLKFEYSSRPLNVTGDMTVSGGSLTAESITAGGVSITGGCVSADSVNTSGFSITGGGLAVKNGVNVSGDMTVVGGGLTANSITAGGVSITGGTISASSLTAGSFAVSGGSIKLPDGVRLMNGSAPAPLSLLKLENPEGLAVAIDDKPWAPCWHGEGDFLYAWLSQTDHTVQVGDKTATYRYDRSTDTFDSRPGASYYDPTNGEIKRAETAAPVTAGEPNWTAGWYVVEASPSFDQRVEVTGDVNLILATGGKLTVGAGIHVPRGSSLTIWQQSGPDIGCLSANVTDIGEDAVIGGNAGEPGGSVTINGGSITINGSQNGAAIGSGQGGSFGDITVNSGALRSYAGEGAVLGAGSSGSCGNITINGGDIDVTASGAAIGCGGNGSCGTITIRGGTVHVQGGEAACGIGRAGGSSTCAGVVITGGSVYAAGGAGMIDPQPTNGTEPLYPLQVPDPARGPVYIDGTPWPPAFYTSGMDTLFAWVTGRDHTVRVEPDDTARTYLFLDGAFVPADSYDWDAPRWEWSSEDDGLTASGTLVIPGLDGTADLRLTAEGTPMDTDGFPTHPCEEDGLALFTVTIQVNGRKYDSTQTFINAPALGHDWDTEGELYPPELNPDGCSVTVFCKRDKSHQTQASLYWEEVPSGYKAPDCATGEAGYRTFDWSFVLDGVIQQFLRQTTEIPAEHTWGAWQEVASTEGTTVLEHTCTVCGATETSTHWHVWHFPAADDTENVKWNEPANGCLTVSVTCDDETCEYHSRPMTLVIDPTVITETITAPVTCTSAGTTVYTASLTLPGKNGDYTGTYTRTVTVPATGHIWDNDDPVWLEDGQVLFRFVCMNDKTHTRDITVTPTVETRQEPTCTEPGLRYLFASATLDGTVAETWRYEPIPALGHLWDTGSVEVSPTGDSVTVSCKRDKTHTRTLSAALERMGWACRDATCAAAGLEVYRMAYELDGDTCYLRPQRVNIPAAPHTWGAWQTIDPADSEGNIMKRTCTVCGAVEKAKHQHTYTFTETAKWDIQDGQAISVTVTATCEDDPNETVTLTYSGDQITVDADNSIEPTCTTAGRTVYTVTAKLGDQSKTYTTTVETPAKGHSWHRTAEQWADDHSQITVTFRCLRCNETTVRIVNTTSTVLLPPGCETEGLTSYTAELDMGSAYCQFAETVDLPALGHQWGPDGTCARCGAVKPAEPPEPGDVTVDVPSPQPDVPAVTVPEADQQTLESAVLTAADRTRVATGEPVTIGLDVTNADDTAPAADKQAAADAIASGLPGYKVGQYLDLSLFKKVGNSVPTVITSTGEKQITLVIAVPEALRASGRTFAIIRVHEGAAAVLNDLDSSADTITIQTNLFSTYAIVYADGATATPTPTPTATSNAAASPKTGDETSLALWTVLLAVSCAGLGLVVRTGKRRRSGR